MADQNTKHQESKDDEIDLIEIFKTLWHYKKVIISTVFAALFLTGVITLLQPKVYRTHATFFPLSETPSLGGYGKILGIGVGASNIEAFIHNLVKSERLQKSVAKKFAPRFKKDIQEAITKNKLPSDNAHIEHFIIEKLNLEKAFSLSTNKNQLFTISYFSTDKFLVEQILNTYLDKIIEYNDTFDISANRHPLTIIDPPSTPLRKWKPNLKLNLALSLIVSFFLATTGVLFYKSFTKRT